MTGRNSAGRAAGLILAAALALAALTFGPAAALDPPTLKWQSGGCYSSWCETGWYSSPAAVDLDGDGRVEVVAAAYSIFALNGDDGSLVWRVDPEGGRVWPGVAAVDLDGDGDLEVVTGHGGGWLHVHDHLGNNVWSRNPTSDELRSLAVADLDGTGRPEIIVGRAGSGRENTWVYSASGGVRSGWPQLDGDDGYAAGIYNDNIAVGDIDGDGRAEVVAPSDVHYIAAYRDDGDTVRAAAAYNDNNGSKSWGRVGVWEDLNTEFRGWGNCDGVRAESYRPNFAHGPAALADLDGDGSAEIAVVGNVYDCLNGHPPGKYNGLFIFNADRTRFNGSGYDWRSIPRDTGAPLSEDYNEIENCQPNPVPVDLDGDGVLEILYPSYDGRMHAFWLDKTQRHNWPFSVYQAGDGYLSFAGEPAAADLDGDGRLEVIFTSWVEKGSGRTGQLYIVDWQGRELASTPLPAARGGENWNGALAAPTLADIDGDGELEVVVNTAHSGVAVYDLPGSAGATVVWGTGRGNLGRDGSTLPPPTGGSGGGDDGDDDDDDDGQGSVSVNINTGNASAGGSTGCFLSTVSER